MSECPLQMTHDEYRQILKCDAVIVREYERDNGNRWAVPVAWGDAEEMQQQAEIPTLQVVPEGVSIVCQRAVLVSELVGGE
jgi:hypothetical protein